MKHLATFSLLLIMCNTVLAQTTDSTENANLVDSTAADSLIVPPAYWKTKGTFNVNFANVGLTNWAGGGVSNISLGSIINAQAVYTKNKTLWLNRIDFALGFNRQGESNFNSKKTDDLLIAESQYGYKLSKDWSATTLLNLRTQSIVGYKYGPDTIISGNEFRTKISNFMAPGFLTINFGFLYKPREDFALTLAPITSRFTFVRDKDLAAVGAFGVTNGRSIRNQFGFNLMLNYKRVIMDNVQFSTNFNAFQDYSTLGEIDINLEALLSFKVNKYIVVTYGIQLIYDEDIAITRENGTIGPDTQFRNVLNIGFSYLFGSENKKKP